MCIRDRSCAVSMAGILKSKKENLLKKSDIVICILTASGLRWNQSMSHLEKQKKSVSQFDPSKDKIEHFLNNI